MGVRGQFPVKLKKFCDLEVRFAVVWHKKTTRDFFLVIFFLVFFFFLGGQNDLLAEIRDIAEKDIACNNNKKTTGSSVPRMRFLASAPSSSRRYSSIPM